MNCGKNPRVLFALRIIAHKSYLFFPKSGLFRSQTVFHLDPFMSEFKLLNSYKTGDRGGQIKILQI